MSMRQRVPVQKIYRPGKLLIPLLGVCVFLAAATAARAQTTSGYLYEYGRFHWSVPVPVEKGFVDAANGDLHLKIKIASIPERGKVPYTASLVYDSHFWNMVPSGTSYAWQPTNVPNSWGGWRLAASDGTGGTVIYNSTATNCRSYYAYIVYQDFTWIAPDGPSIPFGSASTEYPWGCGANRPTMSAQDVDQSGYHIDVTNYTSATVYAPDGTEVYPVVKDTNGNSVNTLSTGSPLTTSSSGNTVTYTVTNSAGNTYNIVVTTESISVDTNFGVGATEYSGSITVIKSITLPDGSSYSFSYDSGTTSGHYGELTGMTLPTGGSVSFAYTNFDDADYNVNRFLDSYTAAGKTWTFTPQVSSGNSCPSVCQQTVTIAKPNDSSGTDDEVHTFNIVSLTNAYPAYPIALDVKRQYYSGSSSSGTLLKTVSATYSSGSDIPSSVTTTLPTPGGGSVSAEATYTYDSSGDGNTIEKDYYDYSGSLFKKTLYTYMTNSDNNMVDKKATITVENGSGTQIAKTIINYDNYGTGGLTSVTGTIGHDDTNFGTAYTARGNPTEIQKWISGTNYADTYLTYDTTGQLLTLTDPNGNKTTFNYTDNYFTDNGSNPPSTTCSNGGTTNAFATTVTLPNNDTIKRGFYCGTGQLAESTGQNGNTTYYHYGSWDRPSSVDYPDGGSTTETYLASNNLEQGTETDKAITSGVSLEAKALVDSWGRVDENLLASDPNPAGQTEVDTTYDGQNRVIKKTTPYRGSAGGSTATTYDGLDRPLTVTNPDSSVASVAYGSSVSGATESCSNGSGYPELVTDAAGNKRVEWFGAFGHVIEVDEPNSSGTLNVKTCYSYDVLGDLTSVTTSTGQTRSYAHDGMGRLTSEATPEGGTVSYTYDNDGDVLTRTAPGPNQTGSSTVTAHYDYDTLNRVIAIYYSNTTLLPNDCTASDSTSARICYYYGQGSYNGLTISNGKGRQTGMSDGSGETAWSYDSMGRVTSEKKTIAGVTKATSYAYNLDGTLATLTYPDGKTVTYTTSAADRQTAAVDSTNSINYAQNATYAPQGALSNVTHGETSTFGGITESWTYNSDLEPESILATSSAGTALSLTYGYSQPGGNNGSVASITNANDNGRNETMTYDSLNRILTAQTAASTGQDCWGLQFGSGTLADDALGNLLSMSETKTGCSGPSLSLSINGNNQISSPNSYSYDAAGDLTADPNYNYTYNDDGRITAVSGTTDGPYCYVYDGDGLRVEKYYANGGTCASPDSKTVVALYWRVYTGQVIEETDGSGNLTTTTGRDYVFFDGRRIAWRDGSGNVYYYFVDTLGSTRVVTDSSGTVCFDADYYPYGQENDYTTTCSPEYKFTGYEFDSETGNYYAYARYYSPTLGRFMSPDPADLAAVSPANPQSWNRYSYVLNNPTSLTDPSGLCDDRVVGQCGWQLMLITGIVGNHVTMSFAWVYADMPALPPGFTLTNWMASSFPVFNMIAGYKRLEAELLRDQPQKPQKKTPKKKHGFVGCTFTGNVGAALGETGLDAVGIIPGGNDIVDGAQMLSAVGAAGISLFGGATGAGLSATGVGIEIAKETGTVAAVHGVEMIPVVGNAVSAGAAIHDVVGNNGVIAAYQSCMSGGG